MNTFVTVRFHASKSVQKELLALCGNNRSKMAEKMRDALDEVLNAGTPPDATYPDDPKHAQRDIPAKQAERLLKKAKQYGDRSAYMRSAMRMAVERLRSAPEPIHVRPPPSPALPGTTKRGRAKFEAYLKKRGHGSKTELASTLGIPRASISRWLSGRVNPSWPMRKRIEEATAGAMPADAWSEP